MPIDLLEKPAATGCYGLVNGFINGHLTWARENFWNMDAEIQADTILQAKFIAERDPNELNFEHFISVIFNYEEITS